MHSTSKNRDGLIFLIYSSAEKRYYTIMDLHVCLSVGCIPCCINRDGMTFLRDRENHDERDWDTIYQTSSIAEKEKYAIRVMRNTHKRWE